VTDEYDAIVYDLDGTLVDLDVDWGATRDAVADDLEDRGLAVDGQDLWELLDTASEDGYRQAVDDLIAEFERDGAHSSRRLALTDRLPHQVPVGVCSLNAESACRLALETHDIAGHVDVVVGRDSVAEEKPHPGPLLAVLEELGVESARALFVGDSESDAECAERAGTDFEWVTDRR
jgi:phosphoglycolate phosphatase-like HAD superfamily hydrolase